MMSELSVDLKAQAKENAARAALDFVEDGMVLGLGSGSTAELFVQALAERLDDGELRVQGVPTSQATARLAEELGVPLLPIEHAERIDLAVDGADEVDPMFNLIKGGGGCLLREKIIADAADRLVVIVDEAKMVEELGAFPLPVEVDPFGFTITAKKIFDALRATGAREHEVRLRALADGSPFISDGGHYILDCEAARLADPVATAARLSTIPGVVEHGLFIDLADVVIVGRPDEAEIFER